MQKGEGRESVWMRLVKLVAKRELVPRARRRGRKEGARARACFPLKQASLR